MNRAVITYLLYLVTCLVFLAAFFLWQGSVLRWVFLFCTIVFGSLGVGKMSQTRQK